MLVRQTGFIHKNLLTLTITCFWKVSQLDMNQTACSFLELLWPEALSLRHLTGFLGSGQRYRGQVVLVTLGQE